MTSIPGTGDSRPIPRGAIAALEPATERKGMAEEVRAEMVANVWKVLVAEGDSVVDGDTLVILESMKMEIPVIAEVDGTVSKVAVQEGGLVQEGDLIAEIS
jgi:acetyl-CoA carboxylase biotin carboxyl carrier protein